MAGAGVVALYVYTVLSMSTDTAWHSVTYTGAALEPEQWEMPHNATVADEPHGGDVVELPVDDHFSYTIDDRS
jgi:hypothetical protein